MNPTACVSVTTSMGIPISRIRRGLPSGLV
jgi:hypothetical protein